MGWILPGEMRIELVAVTRVSQRGLRMERRSNEEGSRCDPERL